MEIIKKLFFTDVPMAVPAVAPGVFVARCAILFDSPGSKKPSEVCAKEKSGRNTEG